jgi:two-component system, LytTR family, sensor kinase
VMEAQVPHLLLQPLVENAIRHGIAPSSAGGTVEIAASRRNGSVHLSVKDDGVGWDTANAAGLGNVNGAGHGVGLANTRLRLQQLYGGAHAMRVEPAAPHGLSVEIEVPFREQTLR